MPLARFVVFTVAGSIPWVLMLAIVGREVGSQWEDWRNYLHYADYAIVALAAIAIGYLIVRRRRGSARWEPSPPR
jgi:membrane protein DedA with SNARE-associated domain